MSKVFRDISGVDTMPSHVEAPSRIFGRTVGKTSFRPGLTTQDRDRLNLHFGASSYMENIADRRLRPSPVPRTVLPLQSKLNQDMRTGNLVQRSTMTGTFGLQTRNMPSLHKECGLNQPDISDVHQKSAMSTVSRTFGLVPEDMNSRSSQKNEVSNLDLRRIGSVSSSVLPRTFGLQTRNLTMNSRFFSENDLRENPDFDIMSCRGNNFSTVSRTFDLGVEKMGGSLSAHDNEGFIRDLRRNGNVNASIMEKPFGHQSRHLNVHSSLLAEGNPNYKVNNTTAFDSLGPGIRSSTMIAESGGQDRGTCNDEMDNGGFRRPTLSRVIRGRNSLQSWRLFHNNQNMDRHCRDLSNINGFNVSHIGRRDLDSLSESRVALNGRNRWMDNQSMSGSVWSAASMKGQFMNLLENLHHSILNMGPDVTVEAVRMEFDKAKQGLENLCDMSLAPSVREADAASIISQSSKYICPPVNERGTDFVIDGGSLRLKSSKEVLKTLISRKDNYRRRFNLSTHAEEGAKGEIALTTSSKDDSEDEEVSGFFFKKPSQLLKRMKTSRNVKAKASEAIKSSAAEAGKKVLNLKQWYPVALGSDLALCGIDEKGVAVKTDPVKKRLNNRRVELVSGLVCDLIGSPSPIVTVLPKKIAGFLKNGLTERWRVLREELVNCQTTEEVCTTRKSSSPRIPRSPKKKAGGRKSGEQAKQNVPKVVCEPKKVKTPRAKKGKSKSPKVVSVSPKRSGKEVLTRSGRAVKPPQMFWLVGKSNEVISSQTSGTPLTTLRGRPTKKEHKSSNEGSPEKKTRQFVGSPKKQHKRNNEGSPKKKTRKAFESPKKKTVKQYKTSNEGSPEKETRKIAESPKKGQREDVEVAAGSASPSRRRSLQGKTKKTNETLSRKKTKGNGSKVWRGIRKKKSEEELRVHSSTEDAKRQPRAGKRKREVAGDIDVVEAKKSKLAKITEIEAESTVTDTQTGIKKGRKKKDGFALGAAVSKGKAKKSPAKKSDKNGKKKTTIEIESETRKEVREEKDFEEDFELELDDVEIPEIANVSGNPQLSRSQMRVISMETPPLKYFNSHLKLRSATPLRSPDWCISQRSESEVKQFQKRREEAFKKKTRVDIKQHTVVTEKAMKTVQSKELKRVMEWITEKTVKSPAWSSRVVQYLIPSRKRQEQQDDEEEEENENEGGETEFLKPSFG